MLNNILKIAQLFFGPLNNSSELISKLAIFFLILAVLAKNAKQWLNKNAAIAIAIIISLIATRFMPNKLALFLGQSLIIAIIILVPYLIVNHIIKEKGLLKIIALIAFYSLTFYIISNNATKRAFFDNIFAYIYYYNWQVVLAMAVVSLYLLQRYAKKRFK